MVVPLQKSLRQGCVRKRGVGGWYPKVCVPKMAQSDFPNGKSRFLPRWSLWSGGGGGSRGGDPPPPAVYGHSSNSQVLDPHTLHEGL